MTGPGGPPIPPEQRLYFYSPDEWETFVREWVTGLKEDYEQIKRLGGPGDQGVDIAAFRTANGFEGQWDCFQAKHYQGALTPSDAHPEILKVLRHVAADDYTMPERYFFVAPRGCGGRLSRLLSKPSELKSEFLASSALAEQDPGVQSAVGKTAECIDFSTFRSVELPDLIDTHRRTPYFVPRFGGPLAQRPIASEPPDEPSERETPYLSRLLEAYVDAGDGDVEVGSMSHHPVRGEHFKRQRSAFYQAESLRLYARDSVPEGTFQRLQDDVLTGVIEILEAEHPHGLARLNNVMSTTAQLDLSSHVLITVSTLEDRKGVCHQLANDGRISWVRAEV